MTIVNTFKTPAESYEEFFVPGIFRPLSRPVLDLARLCRGERVLDLACGTGILARQAAPAVGQAGEVVALDLRPGMLAVARAQTTSAGASIDWRQGDACGLELDDASFDVVLCQQGLQFFPDRAKALAEVKRVSKPGARLVFALWREFECHDFFVQMFQAEHRYLAELGFSLEDAMLPFSLHDPDEIAKLFADANLTCLEISPISILAEFPAEDFVYNMEYAYAAVMPEFAENPGKFAEFVEKVERDTERLRARHVRGGRIGFPMHAHVVAARA